ncbi:MAG: hypothetical protein LBU27_06405 [Candidatus Peribacteria bacterium]|nr:hypothetical protein [Candidatus Peribacteria bacterium]
MGTEIEPIQQTMYQVGTGLEPVRTAKPLSAKRPSGSELKNTALDTKP